MRDPLRAGFIACAATVVLLGMPAHGRAQVPSQPIVTSVLLAPDLAQTTIEFTQDFDAFPDTVLALEPRRGAESTGILILSQLVAVGAVEVSRQGNRVTVVFLTPELPGVYSIRIIAQNFAGIFTSPFSQEFRIGGTPAGPPAPPPPPPPPPAPTGPPTAPVLSRPIVQGNAVTINWTYNGPAVTRFEIVAFVQANGQTLIIPIDANARSFSQGGIPSGNFIVRMRAVNEFGVSDLSTQYIVPVGVTLGAGDLSVTLTWSSSADIDLNLVEPGGNRVYFAAPQGGTARLDRDDTDGFGPENVFVAPGAASSGVYRVYIVHYGGAIQTTSTIQITLYAGTPNERTEIFTRRTSTPSPDTAIEVALVDVRAGTITPVAGISAPVQAGDPAEPRKIPTRQ